LSDSIKQVDKGTPQNVDPSVDRTPDEITIDCSDEYENASDSIRRCREFDSNEMDESDLHSEKYDKRRISIPINRESDSKEIE
jgi:hypothetical protein